jgi:hypothetical protein
MGAHPFDRTGRLAEAQGCVKQFGVSPEEIGSVGKQSE